MVNEAGNSDQEFRVLTQVLEVEKHAQKRLDDARALADTILQEAQKNVRRIETRTDKRIQVLHSQFRKKLARENSHREEAFKLEKNTHAKPIDTDKVKEATKRLAHQIIGAQQE